MLWFRGLIFTILIPIGLGFVLPSLLDPHAQRQGWPWEAGWILIAAGVLIYLWCLLRFLAAGGTPALFFTRPFRFLIGEEPKGMVSGGLYRFSRNPMYLGMVTLVSGQAVLFASPLIAAYGCIVFLCFHLIVVLGEEPHLRATRGRAYEEYCRSVPRWLGKPS